jgi:hypothetical protein
VNIKQLEFSYIGDGTTRLCNHSTIYFGIFYKQILTCIVVKWLNKSQWQVPCYLTQCSGFPNKRHTHTHTHTHTASIFWYALINSMAGPLPNLHAVNPPPTNNPELLLTKSYSLSWLPWTQLGTLRAALSWILHCGYALCHTPSRAWHLSSPSPSLVDLLFSCPLYP